MEPQVPATLADFGFDEGFAATRGHYRVVVGADASAGGASVARDIDATLTGRAAHQGVAVAVGDWVRIGEDGRIRDVLPRKSLFARRAAGTRPDQQLVAANVDVALVVMGLDGDFNARRLERYLTIAWDAGARPVVALSKADLLAPDELAAKRQAAERAAPGVLVATFSGLDAAGVAPLVEVFRPRDRPCWARRAPASRRWPIGCSASSSSRRGRCATATTAAATRRPCASCSSCRAAPS
ncbi:MAG: GTPase RsgA [Myxococcota bacterium]